MPEPQHPVIITDIDIPFMRLVAFFVKIALAAIPASLIVWLIFVTLWALLATLFGVAFWPRQAL
jgi:uncharacterized RDD family membrane protein YckC